MMADALDDLILFDSEIRRPLSVVSPSGSDSSLDGLLEEKAKLEKISFVMASTPPPSRHHYDDLTSSSTTTSTTTTNVRLNKFVRRLHEMLSCEQGRGIVEWRRGVLVLHSINTIFAKEILPKYFGTRNFKTFRRQLNYYGFLHVRPSSASGSASTALWINQELAQGGFDSISSVLRLKRVESSHDSRKTSPEVRREMKFDAATLFAVNHLVAGLNCDEKDHYVDIQGDVISNVGVQRQQGLAQAHDAPPPTSCMNKENHCAQQWSDSFIAACLLLSLADAAA